MDNSNMVNKSDKAKSRRGFAAMDASLQRELASRGGRASHAKGTGHEWDPNAARDAGKKGGIASGVSRRRKKQESVSIRKPG